MIHRFTASLFKKSFYRLFNQTKYSLSSLKQQQYCDLAGFDNKSSKIDPYILFDQIFKQKQLKQDEKQFFKNYFSKQNIIKQDDKQLIKKQVLNTINNILLKKEYTDMKNMKQLQEKMIQNTKQLKQDINKVNIKLLQNKNDIYKDVQAFKQIIKNKQIKINQLQFKNTQIKNKILSLRKSTQLNWSQFLKSKSIIVRNSSAYNNWINQWNYVCLPHVLSKDLVTQWSVKFAKIYRNYQAFSLSVGICLKNQMQSKQFISPQKYDHGTYVATHNGYTFNHSVSQWNNSQQNAQFKFTSGDIVHLKFDPIKEYLQFTKQDDIKTFTMPIPKAKSTDFLACTSICNAKATLLNFRQIFKQ